MKLFPLGNRKRLPCTQHAFREAGEWRFKQKHQTRWGDAMCPLANKAKSISRFTWKIHTGACSFAICGSESSCWESLSLLQGLVGFGLPHRSQNIILTPLCPSVVRQAAKSPGLGGIPLTANSFLGRNGISGPYRDPNCKQAGKIALLTTYLEYYLLRSNYRKSKQKLCKSTSSPEMMEGDGSSFQHGKWKLSIWTFSKP